MVHQWDSLKVYLLDFLLGPLSDDLLVNMLVPLMENAFLQDLKVVWLV